VFRSRQDSTKQKSRMATAKPVSELLITHPDYSVEKLTLYQDLYEGGERFEKNKNKYLRRRDLEKTSLPGGRKLREARLESASYTQHVTGITDYLLAATMQAEPAILASGPENKIAYYNSLNENADGKGNDLPSVVRARLLEAMVQFRSSFSIVFPDDDTQYTDLGAQREAGALDARLTGLDAREIDDWEFDDDGNLLWVRIHTVCFKRSTAFGPRDTEVHYWTFITPMYKQVFEARRSLEDAKHDKWPTDAVAVAADPVLHSLGALPVVPLELPCGLHLLARLAFPALSLFNREASEDFALDTSAYALPVIKSQKDLGQVVMSEMAGLKLDPTDDFTWATPNAAHFQALADNAKRKKENLFGAVSAMALQAAARDNSNRASGVAKFRDYGALATLLSTFGAAARDALEKSVRLIQRARGDEDVTITVTGLDRFDIQAVELLLKEISEFLALPVPQSAKKYSVQKLSLAMCSDAPADVREKIRQEAEKADVPDAPKPAAPVRQENTQEVSGYSTTLE